MGAGLAVFARRVWVGLLALLCAAATGSSQDAPAASMSFFVTSVGRGFGANLGGLSGADAHCRRLASAVGRGDREWRAYLSAPTSNGGAPVHARDRIGKGPWVNARGIQIAANLEELHESGGINRETALTEKGFDVGENRHDILTGSNPDGTLAQGADATCRAWTSHDTGRAMVGHHNRYGGGERGTSWNSAHLSRGCSQQALRASLSAGLIYCFAAD
jgi:hypothetical protein